MGNWYLLPWSSPKMERNTLLYKTCGQFWIKIENGVISKLKAWFYTNSSCVKHSLAKDPNFDQEDNYARTATTESLNLIFAIAAMFDLDVNSGDVPSAYIQADIFDSNIVYYVTQPKGFKDPEHLEYLCWLNKVFYGVLIAEQCWNLTFWKFLIEELQFHCLTADFNLYICVEPDGNFCLFSTVVDDNLDVCTCSKALWKRFTPNWLKDSSGSLVENASGSLVVVWNKITKKISLNQCAFLNNLLESFNCHKIRKSDTPAVSKVLPMPKPDKPPTDFPYASLVGSLIWLTKIHPDISYAISQCFHFLNTHTEDHDKAALWILGYLAKYPDYELVFPKSKSETKKTCDFCPSWLKPSRCYKRQILILWFCYFCEWFPPFPGVPRNLLKFVGSVVNLNTMPLLKHPVNWNLLITFSLSCASHTKDFSCSNLILNPQWLLQRYPM